MGKEGHKYIFVVGGVPAMAMMAFGLGGVEPVSAFVQHAGDGPWVQVRVVGSQTSTVHGSASAQSPSRSL